MKKLLTFFIIIIFISIIMLSNKTNNDIDFFNAGKTQYFVSEINTIELPNYVNKIKNGDGYILECDSNLSKNLEQIISYKGKQIVLEKEDFMVVQIVDSLQGLVTKNTQSGILGFSNLLDKSIFVDSKKINFQIFEGENKIFVGFPILLGSY